MPTVINKRWQKPTPGSVYIGRPSEWGNPFSHLEGTLAKFKVKDRDEAVEEYERYLLRKLEDPVHGKAFRNGLKRLRGKDLVCWCKPARCHGDVLLKYANEVNIDE